VYQCVNFRRKIQTSQEYFDNKLPCLDAFIDTYFENVEEIENNSTELSAKEEIELNETIEEYLEFPEEDQHAVEQIVEEIPKDDKISRNECPIRR
jgi:GTPase SAR1 family protein